MNSPPTRPHPRLSKTESHELRRHDASAAAGGWCVIVWFVWKRRDGNIADVHVASVAPSIQCWTSLRSGITEKIKTPYVNLLDALSESFDFPMLVPPTSSYIDYRRWVSDRSCAVWHTFQLFNISWTFCSKSSPQDINKKNRPRTWILYTQINFPLRRKMSVPPTAHQTNCQTRKSDATFKNLRDIPSFYSQTCISYRMLDILELWHISKKLISKYVSLGHQLWLNSFADVSSTQLTYKTSLNIELGTRFSDVVNSIVCINCVSHVRYTL